MINMTWLGHWRWLSTPPLQAISITQAGKPEDKLELAFRLYDIDRNGSIEQDEMAEIIKVHTHTHWRNLTNLIILHIFLS